MYITNKAVLYIVNEAIGFQAIKWLQNISIKYIQDVLRIYQINTYIRPLDIIIYNTKKNFISKDFKYLVIIMGITTKTVLVEAYWSIRKVKHYYTVLCRTYQIIFKKLPNLNKEMALQIAIKAINNIVGLNRLILTLLVFSIFF